MAQAKRDQNRVTVGLAYNGTTTEPLLVDPITGRLLIDIAAIASGGTISTRITAKHDGNSVPTKMAVTDNASLTPSLLLTDTDGNLLIDLEIE